MKLCKAILTLLTIVLFALFSGNVQAAEQKAQMPSFVDGAKLLSDKDAKTVSEQLAKIEKTHHVRMAIVTVSDSKIKDAGKTAIELLKKNYADGKEGSMLLFINMATRDWQIATDAKMKEKITEEAGIEHIREAFLSKLSDGKYTEAFSAYANTSGEMLAYYQEEGKPFDPMDEFSLFALLAGLFFGGGVYFVAGNALKSSMSNVTEATEADAYVKEGSFALEEEEDTFLYENVSRRAKPSSNDGSSSSASDSSGNSSRGGKF